MFGAVFFSIRADKRTRESPLMTSPRGSCQHKACPTCDINTYPSQTLREQCVFHGVRSTLLVLRGSPLSCGRHPSICPGTEGDRFLAISQIIWVMVHYSLLALNRLLPPLSWHPTRSSYPETSHLVAWGPPQNMKGGRTS